MMQPPGPPLPPDPTQPPVPMQQFMQPPQAPMAQGGGMQPAMAPSMQQAPMPNGPMPAGPTPDAPMRDMTSGGSTGEGRLNALRSQQFAPELPWNCWDPVQLGGCLMKYMEDQEPFYARWAETWYQNFQFVYGNQSLRWSRRYGYAVDSDFLRGAPAQNMRAQTNISRTIAESLSSLIYSNLPTWDVEAAEESSVKGKRFKKIMQKMLDAYMRRLCMDKEFATAAMCYTVFGQVAMFTDWNTRGGRVQDLPQWQKVQAPIFTDYMALNPYTQGLIEEPVQAVDVMGQPLFEQRWQPLLDAQGRQIVKHEFTGDVSVTTLTPFEYRREIGSPGMHRTKFVQRLRLIDYDEFLDEYGHLQGRTKAWNSVRPVYSSPSVYKLAVRHFMRMQLTTPPTLGDIYQRPQSVFRQSTFRNKVLLVDHYDKPHPEKWPKGRRVIVVNGDAVIITTPNYSTNKIDGWHPFQEAQWFNIAPSSIASGPMNDVIQKNRELNVADSLNATALRRNMGSQLLIKNSEGFDPQRLSGEPGMSHNVNDPFGSFRWLHDDMPIPPVVAELRKQNKEDVYETSGAGDAIRGERSVNAESGYAQRQIQEREERRLAPARKTFGYMVAGVGEKMWSCLKFNVVELDQDVMGFLQRSAAGEYQPQDIVALLSTSVDFGVDVNVDADSMAARSPATEQATILELLKGPGVERAKDSKVLDKVFKYFGVEELRDASAPQRDRAIRENEIFSDMMRLGANLEGISPPIVMLEDDDDIHMAEHKEFMVQNSDELMRNEPMMKAMIQHNERHRLQAEEKAGTVAPGTALQTTAMSNAVGQQPPPGLPQIIAGTQFLHQQAAGGSEEGSAGKPPSPGSPTSPQAPSQPAPVGSGGPPQTDTNAPSANTPAGQKGAA